MEMEVTMNCRGVVFVMTMLLYDVMIVMMIFTAKDVSGTPATFSTF